MFVRSSAIWSLHATLRAPDASALDRFGSSVAIDGDTIVVGAPHEDGCSSSITNGAVGYPGDDGCTSSGAACALRRIEPAGGAALP